MPVPNIFTNGVSPVDAVAINADFAYCLAAAQAVPAANVVAGAFPSGSFTFPGAGVSPTMSGANVAANTISTAHINTLIVVEPGEWIKTTVSVGALAGWVWYGA